MKEIEINPLTHQDYSRSSFNTIKKETKDLTIVITAYKTKYELEVILNCLLGQQLQNFKVIVLNDGGDPNFQKIIQKYRVYNDIKFYSTNERFNDWGYTLRNKALAKVDTEWILNTNDDNYYVPTFTKELKPYMAGNDFIMYNCIHSHHRADLQGSYQLLKPKLKLGGIDLGQFVIKTNIVKNLKFNEKNVSADGEFIETLNDRYNYSFKHIDKCLFIHN